MISALRRAAMIAIVCFIMKGKATRQCPLQEKEEPKRGIEPTSSAYQPNAFTARPNGLTKCPWGHQVLKAAFRGMMGRGGLGGGGGGG